MAGHVELGNAYDNYNSWQPVDIFETQLPISYDIFSLSDPWQSSSWGHFIRKPKAHKMDLMLDTEYFINRHSKHLDFLSSFESEIACDMCTAAVFPINYLLQNRLVMGILEEISYEVCMHFKIYGGISSVCRGAIDLMAEPLLPAISEGVLSSFRICNELLHLCSKP